MTRTLSPPSLGETTNKTREDLERDSRTNSRGEDQRANPNQRDHQTPTRRTGGLDPKRGIEMTPLKGHTHLHPPQAEGSWSNQDPLTSEISMRSWTSLILIIIITDIRRILIFLGGFYFLELVV
jgi:hypothetical protein